MFAAAVDAAVPVVVEARVSIKLSTVKAMFKDEQSTRQESARERNRIVSSHMPARVKPTSVATIVGSSNTGVESEVTVAPPNMSAQ